MIKVENIEVHGFEPAIRGMRNPYDSWEKSDSRCVPVEDSAGGEMQFVIGQNDISLMRQLYKGGSEHRKYARMIVAYMDITAPLYWWKELDTYREGVEKNSCSTMHTIAKKEFTPDMFSHEHLREHSLKVLNNLCKTLNAYRRVYVENKDKMNWWQIIQLLPSSYNQRRTVMMSYEAVFSIIRQRTGHKLDEWREFIDVLKGLPYVEEIMDGERRTNDGISC